MKKFTDLITKVDFLGIQLKPTLNGRNTIKSLLGALISVVVTACITFGFVYFGISIIRKDRPIMNVIHERRERTAIPSRDNPFMMLVIDQFGRPIFDNPGFKRAVKVEAHMSQIVEDPELGFSIKAYKGEIKTCQLDQISEKVLSELNGLGYMPQVSLCSDNSSFKDNEGKSFDQEVELTNRFGSLGSTYIHHKFIHCDEEADPGCGDYLKTIGKVVVIMYKLNYYIDSTDYTNPVKPDVIQQSYSVSKTVSQAVYIPSRINEIVTDSSLFLTQESTKTFYTMMTPNITVAEYKPKERVLLDFIVSGEMIVSINQRKYMKILELLANMGGFMKAALFIGNLFSYFYSEYIYFSEVLKIEHKHKQIKGNIVESKSELKHSMSPIKINSEKKAKIPTFFEYFKLLLCNKKKLNKQNSLKYLELNYVIDCLLFVEELKKNKINNFVKQDS